MKILRKNEKFRKMPERNMSDIKAINDLLKLGWEYCSKSIYKEHIGVTKNEKVEEDSSNKKVTKEKRMSKKKGKKYSNI